MIFQIAVCDECRHVWIATAMMPVQCAKCKSRKWNGGNFGPPANLDAVLESVKPVAELADAEPLKPKAKKAERVGQTLVDCLCRHGLYGPLCRQCVGEKAAQY